MKICGTSLLASPLAFPDLRASPTPPDWDAITEAIKGKYGETYADRTVRAAQVRWYGAHRNWAEVVRHALLQLQRHGSSLGVDAINEMAWDLFLYSDNKEVLATGIRAMEPVAKGVESNPAATGSMGPAFIDTYANLLYRAGQTAEAVIAPRPAVVTMYLRPPPRSGCAEGTPFFNRESCSRPCSRSI